MVFPADNFKKENDMNIYLRKKGFTITEMAICVLIIGILAAISVSYYGRFIERMRIAEADTVIGSAIPAQEHIVLRSQHYTRSWHKLDSAPVMVRESKAQNDYSNGPENTIFYTRGGMLSGTPNAGFAISFETDATNRWFAVAKRVGHGGYSYTLIRPFDSNITVCVPDWTNEKDVEMCIDYMGVDTADELADNPMAAEASN